MLIDAAIQMLTRNPSAPLAEIAEAAGVKRVTLHRHFGSRDALLRELALFSLDEFDRVSKLAAKGAKSYTEALRAIVVALVPIGDRFHFLWNQNELWQDKKLKERSQKDDRELIDLIQRAKKEGGIDASIPDAWILASMEATVFAASEAIRSGKLAANDAPELAALTLFSGIGVTGRKVKRGRK